MVALLLAAFPPELAGLDGQPPPGWRVACTGVGALAAAITTARLIAETQPSRILFLGTCGAYDERLPIGSCVAAAEAFATSLDLLEGRAYRPSPERARWPATWELPLPPEGVVVTPGITRTSAGARILGQFGTVEHLELTGVFAAAHAAGIPAAAALAVANQVGPEAHEEWRRHHAKASADLVKRLQELQVFDL